MDACPHLSTELASSYPTSLIALEDLHSQTHLGDDFPYELIVIYGEVVVKSNCAQN